MNTAPPCSRVEALQRAVIARLKDDVAVASLVGGRVYDEVPSDNDRPTPPYIYLGPINVRRVEAGSCVSARAATFRVFAVSTEFGRVEAWAVAEAVESALDNRTLSLQAPWSTLGDLVRVLQGGDVVQPLDPKSTFVDFIITLARTGG